MIVFDVRNRSNNCKRFDRFRREIMSFYFGIGSINERKILYSLHRTFDKFEQHTEFEASFRNWIAEQEHQTEIPIKIKMNDSLEISNAIHNMISNYPSKHLKNIFQKERKINSILRKKNRLRCKRTNRRIFLRKTFLYWWYDISFVDFHLVKRYPINDFPSRNARSVYDINGNYIFSKK